MSIRKILTEEKKSTKQIETVQKIVEKIIADSKEKAESLLREERIHNMAQDFIEDRRKILKEKAEKTKEEYEEEVKRIKEIPESKLREAAKLVVEEVLAFEH